MNETESFCSFDDRRLIVIMNGNKTKTYETAESAEEIFCFDLIVNTTQGFLFRAGVGGGAQAI